MAFIFSVKRTRNFIKRTLPVFKQSYIAKRSVEVSAMHCMQCEQTSHNQACTNQGICGKLPEVSNTQDLLLFINQNIAKYVNAFGETKLPNNIKHPLRKHIIESTFSTVTNVNFSEQRIVDYIKESLKFKDELVKVTSQSGIKSDMHDYVFPTDESTLFADAQRIAGLPSIRSKMKDEDCFGLRECAHYGFKGYVAYWAHAELMRNENEHLYTDNEQDLVFGNIYSTLDGLNNYDNDLGYWLGLCVGVGETNVKVLELLDRSHTVLFGNPEPTTVTTLPVEGKCILVSGHDIFDTYKILDATKDKGISVYTHGELLPAHSYPTLKNKYKHLVGHFGTAWQNQYKDFRSFPGPILMTSNCLMPPRRSYRQRLYTTGPVGYDDIAHLSMSNKADIDTLINDALSADGFTKDAISTIQKNGTQSHLIGFGHSALATQLDNIIGLVKDGKLKNIFVIGGCDGTEKSRNYFTDLGNMVPDDSIILTLGCGKFRLKDKDFGDIAGIPRLLDLGQCNDAYSAVVVATKLAETLGCGINDLPLHFAVSWFEQKAVAVFLSLLHLGITNIKLGPALPGFLTPNVRQYLFDNFGVKQVDMLNVKADLSEFLGESSESS